MRCCAADTSSKRCIMARYAAHKASTWSALSCSAACRHDAAPMIRTLLPSHPTLRLLNPA